MTFATETLSHRVLEPNLCDSEPLWLTSECSL